MSEPTDAQFGNKIKDMVEREGLPLRKQGTNADASPGYFRDVVCMIG